MDMNSACFDEGKEAGEILHGESASANSCHSCFTIIFKQSIQRTKKRVSLSGEKRAIPDKRRFFLKIL
jgi:hypothetical protein